MFIEHTNYFDTLIKVFDLPVSTEYVSITLTPIGEIQIAYYTRHGRPKVRTELNLQLHADLLQVFGLPENYVRITLSFPSERPVTVETVTCATPDLTNMVMNTLLECAKK